jgi:hypothetical protein
MMSITCFLMERYPFQYLGIPQKIKRTRTQFQIFVLLIGHFQQTEICISFCLQLMSKATAAIKLSD